LLVRQRSLSNYSMDGREIKPQFRGTDEIVGGSSLGEVIANIRAFTEDVKTFPRELLPDDVQEQMNHVDKIVEEFASGASIANWKAEGALQMLEQWDTNRAKIAEWSTEGESYLQTKKDLIQDQEKRLHDSRKTLENLETQEIDIRKQNNEQQRRRNELEKRRAEIEEEIKLLLETKQSISSEFEASKEAVKELDSNLESVESSKVAVNSDVEELDLGLQTFAEDDELNAEQEQHDQFLSWKDNVEAVMNEIQKTRELKWKTWGTKEILDWIFRLNHGTFREEEVPRKIDEGVDLLYALQDGGGQIIRELGVTKIRHRDMLIKHIDRLNRNSPQRKQSEKGANPNV